MSRTFAPRSSRWVARQWRELCGWTRFGYAGAARRVADGTLERRRMDMVTPALSRLRMDGGSRGREHPLPGRVPTLGRSLARPRVRQLDPPCALHAVARVLLPHPTVCAVPRVLSFGARCQVRVL